MGDIAIMEPGEVIPCDGVLISGHNIRCDESGATGESDAIKKVVYEEVLKDGEGKKDCFLLSGSKVLEGIGTYVVIAVGERSFNGRILMGLFFFFFLSSVSPSFPTALPWQLCANPWLPRLSRRNSITWRRSSQKSEEHAVLFYSSPL